jgi:hypothetical protein
MHRVGWVLLVAVAVGVGGLGCGGSTSGGGSDKNDDSSSGEGSGSVPRTDNGAGSTPAPTATSTAAPAPTTPPPPARKCASRSGTFTYTTTQLSGNCGPGADPLTFDPTTCTQVYCIPFISEHETGTHTFGPPDLKCAYKIVGSSDRCTTEYTIECPQLDAPGKISWVGKVTWNADGTRAVGSEGETMFAENGAPLCTGMYRITINAL